MSGLGVLGQLGSRLGRMILGASESEDRQTDLPTSLEIFSVDTSARVFKTSASAKIRPTESSLEPLPTTATLTLQGER